MYYYYYYYYFTNIITIISILLLHQSLTTPVANPLLQDSALRCEKLGGLQRKLVVSVGKSPPQYKQVSAKP